jgi:hypothetical protein
MKPSYDLFITTTESGLGGVRTLPYITNPTGTKYTGKMAPTEDGRLGFRLETTGTLSGTFTLWYSNEHAPAEGSDTDWTQDATWAPTSPAGAATNVLYAVADLKARWARVKYVHSAGAGVLSGQGNY